VQRVVDAGLKTAEDTEIFRGDYFNAHLFGKRPPAMRGGAIRYARPMSLIITSRTGNVMCGSPT
jgi:hypothetical protein